MFGASRGESGEVLEHVSGHAALGHACAFVGQGDDFVAAIGDKGEPLADVLRLVLPAEGEP